MLRSGEGDLARIEFTMKLHEDKKGGPQLPCEGANTAAATVFGS